jgi:hypothetical protein
LWALLRREALMTIKAYARTLARELDRLVKLKPTSTEGRHLRDAIIVDAQDKLLVFRTRRDVESANNESERNLRPFAAPPPSSSSKTGWRLGTQSLLQVRPAPSDFER